MRAAQSPPISTDTARACAEAALRGGPMAHDPQLQSLELTTGQAVAVHDLRRRLAYFLVGLHDRDGVVGFVRVSRNGAIEAWGTFGARLASAVTLITSDEAIAAARVRVREAAGEQAVAPLFVCDGAPGREAWLVEVVRDSQPLRWIFVTPEGVYERPAGVIRGEDLEA